LFSEAVFALLRRWGGDTREIEMDKRIAAGVIGAIASLAAIDAARATELAPNPAEILKAASFGDLLTSIPNASASLAALDAFTSIKAGQTVRLAHHHHHHHRRRHHHHHHHRRG
jgi:hypothetical protein